MSSEIRTDLIKDKSNTKTLATLSSSAVTLDSSVVFPAGGIGNPISVAVIADEKDWNVEGGTSSTGSFLQRNLNTVIKDDDSIVSVASNQFTLGAGTYLINWSAPAYKSNSHQSELYDATAGSSLKYGSSEYAANADGVQSSSFGSFIHSPSSSNIYQIRHRVMQGVSTYGFGVQTTIGSGIKNYYTIVVIYKLK